MKKILFYFYTLTIASAMMLSSCSKEGSEGPIGPRGERGETGAQGIPGTDGNRILSGNGAPNATLGSEGDF